MNLTSTVLCDASGVQPEAVKGKALVVMRGQCNFSQKAIVAQTLGAKALLIASNTTLVRCLDEIAFLVEKNKIIYVPFFTV